MLLLYHSNIKYAEKLILLFLKYFKMKQVPRQNLRKGKGNLVNGIIFVIKSRKLNEIT
jgi:hypothetical protein